MSDDRRRAARYRVWFPMRIEASSGGETLAMSQNVSRTGVLMASAERLERGATVSVTIRVPADGAPEHEVAGRVVRLEKNEHDPDGLWPYHVAIEFEAVLTGLEPLLAEAANKD